MKIDKTRFFAITGVLAAASGLGAISACTLTTVNGGEPDAATTPLPDSSTTDPDATTTGDSSTTTDATTTDATADASSCLGDDKMLNPSCASFADAGTNCASSEGGQFYCPNVQANYVNGVARSIMQCLSLAPTCEAVPDPFATCTLAALDKACPDAAAAAPCAAAAQACAAEQVTPTINQAKCQQYYSGLSSVGRTRFTSCAAEGCALVENAGCF